MTLQPVACDGNLLRHFAATGGSTVLLLARASERVLLASSARSCELQSYILQNHRKCKLALNISRLVVHPRKCSALERAIPH